MSNTGTVGRFCLSCIQCPPRSVEVNKPNSVPRKSKFGFLGCSRITFTVPFSVFRFDAIDLQVSPKSFVSKT